MAAFYWSDVVLYVGEYEAAGAATSFSLRGTRAELPRTTLNTTGWTATGKGLRSSTLDMDFLQDVATASIDEKFHALLATDNTPVSIAKGSADGSLAFLMNSAPTQYVALQGNVGENAMGHLSTQTSGLLGRGLVLHPGNVARSTSSTGVARQMGAVLDTQKVYGALHILAVSGTGTPTLTATIQSDDNQSFTSFSTKINFGAKTTVGGFWGSGNGPITDVWWRSNWTISGTSPSFLFAITCAIY